MIDYPQYDPLKHESTHQSHWHEAFAFLPKVINGKKIWLEHFEYRYHFYYSHMSRFEDETYIEFRRKDETISKEL